MLKIDYIYKTICIEWNNVSINIFAILICVITLIVQVNCVVVVVVAYNNKNKVVDVVVAVVTAVAGLLVLKLLPLLL